MLRHRNITSVSNQPVDFTKLRVGPKVVNDVLINLNPYDRIAGNFGSKDNILHAIQTRNVERLREISDFFYRANGIYYNICRYFATLYRFDWYITPFVIDSEKEKENKVLKDFSAILNYFDKSQIKYNLGKIANAVMKDGIYYGMIMDFGDKVSFQQLSPKYCRCRFYSGADPVIELNLQFFDSIAGNFNQKITILKLFPKEVQQAYIAYKEGKLKGDNPGDKTCWFALEPGTAFKICLDDAGFPPFVDIIPALIDLDEAQELDRKKMMQQLVKILVQKLPLDKNSDLVFDVDEARDIHENAVHMISRAIGFDVLTTFADIEKIDAKDTNSSITKDELEKPERAVFNEAGLSENLFNPDGNLALANSILVNEARIRDIPLLFEALLNKIAEKFNRTNHYDFRVTVLQTTQFNYQALAKLYKEQAQMGFDLLLPQIALGHAQSTVLAAIDFQNNVLHLAEKMIPPMTSNVQSAKNLQGGNNQSSSNKKQDNNEGAGRPQKEDSEKSVKTIQNIESQS